jgi:hypothetical protein
MEASGTTPPAEPAQPPPPPPPTTGTAAAGDKAGPGWRLLAVVLALILAFGAAVMIVVPLNPDDTPRCEQIASGEVAGGGECYELTKTQQTIQNIFAWPAGIIGAAAALMALYFAATGRRGQLLLRLTGVAVVLGVGAFVVGQL